MNTGVCVLEVRARGFQTKEYTHNDLHIRENKALWKTCKSQEEAKSMRQARWCKERRGAGGEMGRLSTNTSRTPSLFFTQLYDSSLSFLPPMSTRAKKG